MLPLPGDKFIITEALTITYIIALVKYYSILNNAQLKLLFKFIIIIINVIKIPMNNFATLETCK